MCKLSNVFNADCGHITSRSQGRGRIRTSRGGRSLARCHCMDSSDLKDPCLLRAEAWLSGTNYIVMLPDRHVLNRSVGKARSCSISQSALWVKSKYRHPLLRQIWVVGSVVQMPISRFCSELKLSGSISFSCKELSMASRHHTGEISTSKMDRLQNDKRLENPWLDCQWYPKHVPEPQIRQQSVKKECMDLWIRNLKEISR